MKTFLVIVCLILGVTTAHCNQPSVSAKEAKQLASFQQQVEVDANRAVAEMVAFLADDESAALRFALAVYYLQHDDLNNGASQLKKVIANKADYHQARFEYARVVLQQGHFDAGAKELSTLLQSNFVKKLECWKLLGYCYMGLNNGAAAETAYRQALVLDGGDDVLVKRLIRALFLQNKFEEARPLIRQQLRKDPANAKWWELLAGADLQKGKGEDALVRLECARRLGVATDSMLADLAELYLQRELPEQAAGLYKYLIADTHIPVNRLIRGISALAASERVTAAKALITKLKVAHQLRPKQQISLQLVEAEILVQGNKASDALKVYDEILLKSPLEAEALHKSADILRRNKQYEKSIVRYQRLKRLPGYKAKALLGLAQIEVKKGNYRQAILFIKESLSLKPNKYVLRYLESIKKLVR